MVTHSPGPWIWGDNDVDGSPFVKPGNSWPFYCQADAEEAEAEDYANARLMAAAPDLLHACQRALDAIGRYGYPIADVCAAKSILEHAIAQATTEAP